MKKVLIVTALAGFVRSFLENDIKILKEKGYDVYCIANQDHPGAGDITGYFDSLGVKFYNAEFSSNKPISKKTMKAYKVVKKIIEENEFEMIHVHTPIAGIVTKLAARKRRKKGCKVIYTVHGFFFHNKSGLKRKFIYRNVEKWASKYTDMIITINREDFEAAKKMKSKEVRYINGVGVDTEIFQNVQIDREAYRENLGIKKGDIVVLSIGELSDRKNHRIIVEALGLLKNPKYLYIICGNDMNEDGTSSKLKQLAEEKNVRLKLMGLRRDIPEVCRCSDIGAFPSSREGLGLAGIEMMAGGLPVVTSDVQGIKDYSKDGITGYMYDASDAEGFAEGIKKLSNQSVRKSMKEACIQSAKQFDKKISHMQMQKIYDEILG